MWLVESQLLIVNPTYRPDWLLPGGSVDEDESPLEAVRREVKEELGLEIPITRLLCLDYVHREQPKTESLQFIFAGGLLRPEEIAHIVLQESELSEYRFVALEEAASLLHWRIARRVEYCLTVQNTETVIYLEDSQPVEFSGL